MYLKGILAVAFFDAKPQPVLTAAAAAATLVLHCSAGATALISETGLLPLGSERLRVCNLTGGTFSNCVANSGFSNIHGTFASGNTVW